MAVVKVVYQCGCGFKTEDAQKAADHSDRTQHQMDVRGSIHPIPRPPVEYKEPPKDVTASKGTIDFSSLRKRLEEAKSGQPEE